MILFFKTGDGKLDFAQVQVFCGLDRNIETGNIGWVLDAYGEDIPDGTIPIARGPGDQLILIGVTGSNFDSILFIDFTNGLEGNEATTLTSSFSDFFDSLFDFDPIKELGID